MEINKKRCERWFTTFFILKWCHQQENYCLLSVDYHRFIVSSIWKSTWFSTRLCFIVLHRYKNDSIFKYLFVSISSGILLRELLCWYLKLYISLLQAYPMIYPTNLLRAFAVVRSWSNTVDKDNPFFWLFRNEIHFLFSHQYIIIRFYFSIQLLILY